MEEPARFGVIGSRLASLAGLDREIMVEEKPEIAVPVGKVRDLNASHDGTERHIHEGLDPDLDLVVRGSDRVRDDGSARAFNGARFEGVWKPAKATVDPEADSGGASEELMPKVDERGIELVQRAVSIPRRQDRPIPNHRRARQHRPPSPKPANDL
jgi:hypothetical protein